MAIRNRHKIGDYLLLDDESGLVHYRSDMRMIWNGTWRHQKNFETRQPQEFITALNDPKALRHVRPENNTPQPTTVSAQPANVGSTGVTTPVGPASHLFD